jgi:Raf kinase inhibitor-like YbhB/YbcL family protein
MKVTSPAFEYGRQIPVRHTCDGEGVSPRLRVDDIPAGAISLAVIVEDPDAPAGTWIHWILFDLPPDPDIPEGASGIGVDGLNSWRRAGYGGPCPPSGTHRYMFRIFALDDTLRLPERSTQETVEAAMRGKVLDEAVLMGRYGR